MPRSCCWSAYEITRVVSGMGPAPDAATVTAPVGSAGAGELGGVGAYGMMWEKGGVWGLGVI